MSSFLDNFFSGYINQLAQEFRVVEDVCPDCQAKTEPLILQFNEEDSPVTVYQEKEIVWSKCAQKTIPTIYIVYSGGDDLLVLGLMMILSNFLTNSEKHSQNGHVKTQT